MTDLEMTKLCAEAMGFTWVGQGDWQLVRDSAAPNTGAAFHYFPLTNDAQAMALVKKLGLTIDPQEDKPPFTWRVVVADDGDWDKQIFAHGRDLNRAIVECAAAVQAAKVAT